MPGLILIGWQVSGGVASVVNTKHAGAGESIAAAFASRSEVHCGISEKTTR